MQKPKLKDYADVLTPAECIELLSIGRNSLYRLLRDGQLRSVRIGRSYRIPKSAVVDFLNSCYNEAGVGGSDPNGKEQTL